MTTLAHTGATADGRSRRWIAGAATWISVLFLLFSGTIKFFPNEHLVATFAHLGLPLSIRIGLALLELLCTLVYAVPRTRALGAILLTGYLGGAVVTHLRVGDPWFSHTLFPLYLGGLLWTGLLLRDRTLREALLGRLSHRRMAT